MSEYVYATNGTPVSDTNGEISLPRERIVRCRDCAFFREKDWRCTSFQWHSCAESPDVEPDGFCAWGEKRVQE